MCIRGVFVLSYPQVALRRGDAAEIAPVCGNCYLLFTVTEVYVCKLYSVGKCRNTGQMAPVEIHGDPICVYPSSSASINPQYLCYLV